MIDIGINALYLIPGGVGGSEIYLRCLLAALARVDPVNRYTIYTNRETGPDLVPAASNFRYAPQPVAATNRAARILYEQLALAWRANHDVLFNAGFTAPLLARSPQVTVFFDLQHKRHPEHFRWFDLPAWRFLLWGAAHRSRRIIAISHATRNDLLRYYRLPPERIRVIPVGVDEHFFEIGRRRGATEPWLLCVSTLHPHKNIERLVSVFARLRERHPEWTLILAGMRGFHTESVETLIRSLHLEQAVRLTGWIPREELYDLYRRARAFVYPSTFEGFGMPVLEALAAGIPTACSDIEPLRSVAGGAALLFPPEDDDRMLAVLDQLVSGARARTSGPAHAARFGWDPIAQTTLDVLIDSSGRRANVAS